LMWGLKVQMPYLLPDENLELNKEDRFPMSIGMKQLLHDYGFDCEPDLKVTRHIINLAGVVRECDRCVRRQDYTLRSAADHLKRISRIDTKEWDLMKLATALKMICYPGEKIPAAPLLFPKGILEKLRKDAPKYESKLSKEPVLSLYNEMYQARCIRSKKLEILRHLLQQKEKVQEVIVQLTKCNESLLAECSKRQNPLTVAQADVIGRYTCISSHQLHRMNEPGILSMDIHPSKDVVATGGIDTNAVLFDRPSSQILCTLTGHSKKITTLKFVNVNGDELFITGSADETVRMWCVRDYGNYNCVYTLKDHTAEVAAVAVQESEKCFVSVSKDNTWCLYDILTGTCKSKVSVTSVQDCYRSASFHPHGPLLGTGMATAVVEFWDMRTKSLLANLKGHRGPVTAMSFSGNGYLLATAARDGVRLWDIRRLKYLSIISPYDSCAPINAVEFDSSGSYLGIGGSDARVYQADKDKWNIINTLSDLPGTGKVTSLKFGADAKYIAVGSVDCNLRMFGLLADEPMDI